MVEPSWMEARLNVELVMTVRLPTPAPTTDTLRTWTFVAPALNVSVVGLPPGRLITPGFSFVRTRVTVLLALALGSIVTVSGMDWPTGTKRGEALNTG